ncbi:uncharacterized protein MYCFIDRAFT_34940 [Pseudocercospora fijiensis CIRAD86]|uniref:Major facilitator superfamily (MFS) profile domain-containing protein n=1 Tax=Pseudocercospora fijiensis (strain CIRAD86) TaxID=383855 RepID=M3APN5_PSEFD|nr:uncharacterized protein MYCFIDRAFT_34940 [Pseudocercospora fijiensis CIRAD86]EME79088.1 hypothetical protein MYCFIDRAFT_34940 [Pseudocercospora fijiensis CIRAD86]
MLPKQSSRAFASTFAALSIMVFIASLDATALSTSLAVIANVLHGTTLSSFWASTAFLLANVVSLPLYLALTNIVGRVYPLHAALLLFLLGSIIFALASNMTVLVIGRIFQGLGAGGMDVIPEIIVSDITELKKRPLYLGLLGLPMAAGSVLGPIIGAALADGSRRNWRWIGWINLPLCTTAFGLMLLTETGKIDFALMVFRARVFDWIGMLLCTTGLTLFVLPISWAGALAPWKSWRTIVPLGIGFGLLILLVVVERRRDEPMFPRRLMKPTTAKASLIAVFLHGAIVYVLLLYLPLFFQAVHLQQPMQTVVSMLPLNLAVIICGFVSGVIVERFGQYVWTIRIGASLLACGVGLLSLLKRSTLLVEQTMYELIAGIGLGSLYTILTIPMQASVLDPEDMGLAAGMIAFARLLGGAFGLAISSTAFSSTFHLSPGLLETGRLVDANDAISFIPMLRSTNLTQEVLGEAIASYRTAFSTVWYEMTGCSVVAFLAVLCIKALPLQPSIV